MSLSAPVKKTEGSRQIVQYADYIFYNLNGTNYLVAYTGHNKDIVLPNNYIGSSYAIYNAAFIERTEIESLVVPDGVIAIGDNAFGGCTGLTSVKIAGGKVGAAAFMDCSALAELDLGSVTSIGSFAFQNCKALTELTIPETVENIETQGFSGVGITTLYLNIPVVKSYAFASCTELTTIVLGEDVKLLHNNAFSHCSKLTSVTLPEGLTEIASGAFMYCRALEEIVIPSSVTLIGLNAFQNCTALTSVTLVSYTGWKVFPSASTTGGISVSAASIAVPADLAAKLTGEYVGYTWRRS